MQTHLEFSDVCRGEQVSKERKDAEADDGMFSFLMKARKMRKTPTHTHTHTHMDGLS